MARRLVTEPPARWPEAVTRPNPGPGTAWWPASAKAPPPGTSPPVGEAGGAAGGGSGPGRGPRAPEASGCWPKPARLWPVFPAPTKVAPGGAELKPQGVDGRGSSVTPEPNAPLLLGGNLVLAGLPPGQGSHTLPRSKSPGESSLDPCCNRVEGSLPGPFDSVLRKLPSGTSVTRGFSRGGGC